MGAEFHRSNRACNLSGIFSGSLGSPWLSSPIHTTRLAVSVTGNPVHWTALRRGGKNLSYQEHF